MNFNEYQQLASRTTPKGLMFEDTVKNFCMGLSGEAGEVVDYLKKVLYHGHEWDRETLIKELGDAQWYISQIARAYSIKLSEVAEKNIEKLRARYPEGFSEERSINRDE